MPFDDRWFYGDALFIVDPWLWLVLGLPVVWAHSASRRSRIAWTLLGVFTTFLVLRASVPWGVKVGFGPRKNKKGEVKPGKYTHCCIRMNESDLELVFNITEVGTEVSHTWEREGLYVTDIEILRLHYAETLKLWHERFEANREEIAALYDERFCRMWELYLKASEMSFRHQAQMVFQLQLTKRLETLPITRDYMVDWERRRGAESVRAAE